MSVSHLFIVRPIATSLLAVATILGGILGYFALPISSLPQVDFPTVEVTTELPGASPETMSTLVTASLERQFGQIQSLAAMSSTSSFGLSRITLQFNLDRDIDAAAQDVQAAINAAGSTLPKNLPYPPTYSKVNPADTPIVTLALTSDTQSLRSLSDLADTLLAQRLASVSGVGHVSIEGGIKPAVRVEADVSRLASYGLSMADLSAAIASANVSGPKGSIDGVKQSYTIAANDQIDQAHIYEDVIIAYRNEAPVRVKDVAKVTEGLENTRVGGWYNGKPAVIVDVQRQPGANVIDTVNRIKDELPRVERSMPAGVNLQIVSDRTGTIEASVRDVQFTLVLSVGLVVMVVLLFLRSLRATIIAGVALPVSLIATFGVMYFCGFSLDNLSLMALTIGTGFVVDDAIVMIENVVRHIEKGEKPMKAALDGAREIGFTVISLTLSLIAVFIPLLFMTGLVGRMFREFAMTLTIAVVVSAIVSLTLTPMMCSKLLRGGHDEKSGIIGRFIERVIAGYDRSLEFVFRHQGATLIVALMTVVLTIWLYVIMPKGFLPDQDTGAITAVVEGSPQISFTEMTKLQKDVAAIVATDRDVAGVASIVGIGQLNATQNVGSLKIMLKPRDERESNVVEVIQRLKREVKTAPGTMVYFQPVQDVQISTQSSRARYQYTLASTDSAEVTEWSKKMADALRTSPFLRNVATEEVDGGLIARIDVDRVVAGRLGVTMQAINDALSNAFGQRQVSTIYEQANQYRVVLEAAEQYRSDPSRLNRLYVASTTAGTPVLLTAVAKIKYETAPLAISHQDQFPAITISFNLAPNASLSDALAAIDTAKKDIDLPATVSGTFYGDAAEFSKSLQNQPWLILAAIVTIYIVLGVLYESLIHPFTILTTLPSAGIGAALALELTGNDLSFVALIGIILLMGIVKKNAIMMIDFALEAERERGLSPRASIKEAALLRFRPIMMTTLAALFGALPLALESGTGSELRNPLGITIVGGLLLSQLLTLYTTPVIYLAMERLRARLGGRALDANGEPVAAAPEQSRAITAGNREAAE
ncbi:MULTISPECIES: efflux RND transporter permease subunit [unclassified Hyphomicrobium]|uniref:efflux RND transporter permease subunit n=1 Tax=unclassified Hyphomicrobium TaxID=2619925 RepID=UPI000213EB50|nr:MULTISPECIES: efflux RND transporter permease subunit [unclassified Hyphomicrobium]CCB66016.1 RND efflux transporter, HME family, translocase subunit [Hyphomicrobium sp. MC1]